MKRIQIFTILLSVLALTSCRMKDDPSTVDPKPSNTDGNMDLSIKPGDNFFMYCNGTWWNKTIIGSSDNDIVGSNTEAQNISKERLSKVTNESITKFWHEVNNIDNTAAASIELIKNNLKLVENITTSEEAANAVVKVMLAGYDNIMNLDVYMKNRDNFQPSFVLSPNFSNINFDWAAKCMHELGISDASYRARHASALFNQLSSLAPKPKPTIQNILDNPELREDTEMTTTKATSNIILQKAIAAYGLDPQNYVETLSMARFFNYLSEDSSPYAIQCLLQAYIASDYRFTSKAAYNDYLTLSSDYVSFENAMNNIKDGKMGYIYAHAYTKKYVTPELKAKMVTHCEEIRTAFRERISKIEWMSQTTKQNAKEKLDAMVFNVAYPETWIEVGLPSLKGVSLLEDILALTRANKAAIKALTLKDTKERDYNFMLLEGDIELINAAYIPFTNSINILPAWLLEPLYDNNLSDAHNYAMLVVIGHEITHGFDITGAKFDKFGNKGNWWTVSDNMEFVARQQKLIDCYNNLEIMPKELPGVVGDGRLTLGENMADLGGFMLAFDSYNTKLVTDGYKDEEIKKQHKKFYQAYANLWRHKYSAAHANKALIGDVHSLSQERINGVVMNVDYWYDLYDVKWGDKLYLKPENRSYIW